jgi:glycosyltransferase involved in cell wall biosynthesis
MCIFSIVIITRNRKFLLEKTLPPLLEFAKENNGEVIVVDDNSTDNTSAYLYNKSQEYKCLFYFFNVKNYGIGKSRNIGIQQSKSNIIFSIDDDIIIEPEALKRSIKSFDRLPHAGIIAPVVVEKDTGLPLNGVSFSNDKDIRQVANYCGGFGILRKNAIIEGGYFDEETTYGADERSISMKVHNVGYEVLFDPSLKCLHIDTVDRSKPILYRFSKKIFNDVRLNFRYLPFFYATLYSLRYALVMLIIGRGLFPWGSVKLIKASIDGIKKGIIQHEKLSPRTIKYYTSSKLQPQYGNRSLVNRVITKFKKKRFYN